MKISEQKISTATKQKINDELKTYFVIELVVVFFMSLFLKNLTLILQTVGAIMIAYTFIQLKRGILLQLKFSKDLTFSKYYVTGKQAQKIIINQIIGGIFLLFNHYWIPYLYPIIRIIP